MATSKEESIVIWFTLLERFPSSAIQLLRKIRDGEAKLPERDGPTSPGIRLLDWRTCFNASWLVEYLNADAERLNIREHILRNNFSEKNIDGEALLKRLDRTLALHGPSTEASELYHCMQVALECGEKESGPVSTEPYAEFIWRALIIIDHELAKELMEKICRGDAYFKTVQGFPGPILFSQADVLDGAKLECFLAGMEDRFDFGSLLRSIAPGQAGDFYAVFNEWSAVYCTKEQKQKFHEMFFGRMPDPKPISETPTENPEVKFAGLIEAHPTKISKTFDNFIECGKLLGIPVTTLAILLPEETRQKIRMEILKDMLSK